MKVKKRISKAGGEGEKKVYRLTEIDPEFVSLVEAGANRQKEFQVVKADEETPEEPNAGDEQDGQGNEAEKNSQPSGSNDQDPQGEDKTGKGGDGNDADGGSADGSGTDLSSWLDEAGATVETMSLDHAIQAALDGQSDGGADGDTPAASKANEIGQTGAPSVEKVGEEAEAGEDERDARIAKLEAKLKKQARELTRIKAQKARLTKGVGQTSVMATGEVTSPSSQQSDDESPTNGVFRSGGDIAAAVAAKEG